MNAAPGWYPDTEATGGERWWDGTQWSYQRRPAGEYVMPAPRLISRSMLTKIAVVVGVLAVVGVFLAHDATRGYEVDSVELADKVGASIKANGGPAYDLTCDEIGRAKRGDVTFCRGGNVLIKVTFGSDGKYAYEAQ